MSACAVVRPLTFHARYGTHGSALYLELLSFLFSAPLLVDLLVPKSAPYTCVVLAFGGHGSSSVLSVVVAEISLHRCPLHGREGADDRWIQSECHRRLYVILKEDLQFCLLD